MDQNSGLAILGAAIGSKDLIVKVLGPTADYLGAGIRDFTQQRVQTIRRIFQRADALLGDSASPNQAVPPRILRDVLNDGSYRDDELTVSYYGGILASSRSGISRDDRGAALTALIGRLTTYQLRAHYILYRAVNEIYSGTGRNLKEPGPRAQCSTYLSSESYVKAMDLEEGEDKDILYTHVFFGLAREALIGESFHFGPVSHIQQFYPKAASGGVIFTPSALGVELFLWGVGSSVLDINAICKERVALPEFSISSCPDAASTREPKKDG